MLQCYKYLVNKPMPKRNQLRDKTQRERDRGRENEIAGGNNLNLCHFPESRVANQTDRPTDRQTGQKTMHRWWWRQWEAGNKTQIDSQEWKWWNLFSFFLASFSFFLSVFSSVTISVSCSASERHMTGEQISWLECADSIPILEEKAKPKPKRVVRVRLSLRSERV